MIDCKDISVVVQGAIDKINTPKCIKSIRKSLPNSKIILSTWEGSDVSNLDYDTLVLSKDPGGFFIKTMGFTNNTNRQIISTKCGLGKVNTKYAIKTRSDCAIKSVNFLKYFTKLPNRNPRYTTLKERIVVSSFFLKKFNWHPSGLLSAPFHISDWFFFGLTEDLNQIFDIPTIDESDLFAVDNSFGSNQIQFAPEQIICFSHIKKHVTFHFNHCHMVSSEICDYWDNRIVNNCIVLDNDTMKLQPLKQPYSSWSILKAPQLVIDEVYREFLFFKDYKLQDRSFKIPTKSMLKELTLKLLNKI